MLPEKIIGLDIGSLHNGVAIISTSTAELLHVEVCTRERLLVNVENLRADQIAIVGLEKFVLYPWAASAQAWKSFPNIEIIGAVKYILEKSNIPFFDVKAVDSKNVYSKDRLKRMGYEVGSDLHDHKRDALSVALYTRDKLLKKGATRGKKGKSHV